MKCSRCGTDLNELNYHYIPKKDRKEGLRYCLKCTRDEKVVTLI